MAELDPELRDKIIETHTLVKRIDEEQKEHKTVVNARLREQKIAFEKHQEKIDENFNKHESRIAGVEHFRTRVMAVAVLIVSVGSFVFHLIAEGLKKFVGLGA